jgi:endonuclease YncB( thermonuclease family)
MLRRLIAILTISRRTDSLTGPAKVIDGDTIVVAEQLVRLHGIDAPLPSHPSRSRGRGCLAGAAVLSPATPRV